MHLDGHHRPSHAEIAELGDLAGIGAVAGIFDMSEAGAEAGSSWVVAGVIAALATATAPILRRIDWI